MYIRVSIYVCACIYILFMYVLYCTRKVFKGKDHLLMANFKNIVKVVRKLNLPVLFSETNFPVFRILCQRCSV